MSNMTFLDIKPLSARNVYKYVQDFSVIYIYIWPREACK